MDEQVVHEGHDVEEDGLHFQKELREEGQVLREELRFTQVKLTPSDLESAIIVDYYKRRDVLMTFS